MARPNISFGGIQFGIGPAQSEREDHAADTPFRILVLGDFSGRASRGVREPLDERKALTLDRDNFEQVMARLGVKLRVELGSSGRMTIPFAELDDFRPDRLYRELEIFDKLRSTRARLESSTTFAKAAEELQGWSAPPAEKTAAAPAAGGDLLDLVFASTTGHSDDLSKIPGGVDWNNFLQRVVGPYVVPKESPHQAEMIDVVDQATSGLMRALLHQRGFQALEAAWRGLWLLIRRLPTDATLKICLLDVSREELTADVGIDELDHSSLYRLLVKETVGTPGGKPWGVVAGLYRFGASKADAELLARLSLIHARAGAPLLAGAEPSLVGCAALAKQPDPDDWKEAIPDDVASAWAALREFPEAGFLGLALPRFLLRLPYGKDTDEVEPFDFEEACERDHESYLWGSSAVACACLLGEAFASAGWSLRPGLVQELDNLPVHIYKEEGEPKMQPVAEILLSVKGAERMLAAGLMPLLSIQGRDAVRLGQFVALNGKPLQGRWK